MQSTLNNANAAQAGQPNALLPGGNSLPASEAALFQVSFLLRIQSFFGQYAKILAYKDPPWHRSAEKVASRPVPTCHVDDVPRSRFAVTSVAPPCSETIRRQVAQNFKEGWLDAFLENERATHVAP